MAVMSQKSGVRILLAATALSASGVVFAQVQDPSDPNVVVNGRKSDGPEIKGVISARNGDKLKVTAEDGSSTIIAIDDTTQIRSGGGLFSSHGKRDAAALLNGLPVSVKTVRFGDDQSNDALVASQIKFRNNDFKTASMIRNGTAQRFDEQTAATESLRGRMADIDKYNIKATTNVHFDTGKAVLSQEDKAALCNTASSAQSTENALMLVVGYTDSTGGEDINQELSEKRANRVINYLQQACGWKPYRMLTPTGMAKADPLASNDTPEGKAQNRRVAVNILVSKSVDGL
ncbi:OmpA family protein [Sphingomonas sp. ASY06-1R]|uniref:OmpA family protein n=1 Tax=Sphingomonas sp. ASY06-1R TaxID=3445771 RepID=UPI003FA2BA1A